MKYSGTCAIGHSDILWHPTKIYGPKVFRLAKIKPEYSDILYNPTHLSLMAILIILIKDVRHMPPPLLWTMSQLLKLPPPLSGSFENSSSLNLNGNLWAIDEYGCTYDWLFFKVKWAFSSLFHDKKYKNIDFFLSELSLKYFFLSNCLL
jgi:hypothetical protein